MYSRGKEEEIKRLWMKKIYKIAHDKYNNSTPNPLPNILAPYTPFK